MRKCIGGTYLRLSRGGEVVGIALELVADVLGGRLLRVRLERGTGLVGESLASVVGHDDL